MTVCEKIRLRALMVDCLARRPRDTCLSRSPCFQYASKNVLRHSKQWTRFVQSSITWFDVVRFFIAVKWWFHLIMHHALLFTVFTRLLAAL